MTPLPKAKDSAIRKALKAVDDSVVKYSRPGLGETKLCRTAAKTLATQGLAAAEARCRAPEKEEGAKGRAPKFHESNPTFHRHHPFFC